MKMFALLLFRNFSCQFSDLTLPKPFMFKEELIIGPSRPVYVHHKWSGWTIYVPIPKICDSHS